jgi:GH25 family lysozyme M1 (1,4-beta-N-acetylmuramidase)
VLAAVVAVGGAGSATARTSQLAPKGIDLSHWNGAVDWSQVATAGYAFALLNATEGTSITDATYPLNRFGAGGVGVRVGAYHFARPTGSSDAAVAASAIAQADYFLAYAQPKAGDLLPVLDLEATGGLSSAQLTAWTQAWLEEVRARLGVAPVVYASPHFWQTALGDTPVIAAAGDPLWIAHWTQAALPILPGAGWGGFGWTFWQWTDCTKVPGIVRCVDGDRFNGDDLGVASIPPAPRGPPIAGLPPEIVGTPETGQLLAATPGDWSGGKPIAFAYQWERCSPAQGCTTIDGATSETYTPTPADAAYTLEVSVAAQGPGGTTASATSPPTLAVAGTGVAPAAAPTTTTTPSVQGTAQAGQTLTAVRGKWTGAVTAFAYQWRRCAANGVSCVAITGAARTQYTLTPDDIGETLVLVVTATGRGGSRSATSATTAAIAPAPIPAPAVGSALAQPGQAGAVASPDQTATVTWQPGAVPANAAVTLGPSASRLALPSTALSLGVGAAAPLPWALDLQFAVTAPDAVPGFLPGSGVWQPLAELASPALPSGQQFGAYRDAAGALHVLTRVPGRVALFAAGHWGDPRFDSASRPSLTLITAPTVQPRPNGTVLLLGRFTLDSQAHVYASVVDPGGARAVLLQQGSRLGWWLQGLPTKTFQTLQLRPGAFPIRARIPAQQLRAAGGYTLRIVAIDPYGRRAQLLVPFTPPG